MMNRIAFCPECRQDLRFSVRETPWISTRGNLPAEASTDKVISKQIIGEYFSSKSWWWFQENISLQKT